MSGCERAKGVRGCARTYLFDETLIEGEATRYTHIVINLPYRHIPHYMHSFPLLLSQLVEAFRGEERKLILSIHLLDGEESRFPVEFKLLTDENVSEVVAVLTDLTVEQKRVIVSRRATEKSEWQVGVKDLFSREEDKYTILDRLVLSFFPEDQTDISFERTDLLRVESDTRFSHYPFVFLSNNLSEETERVLTFLKILSPCDMHRRYVELFGDYAESRGLPPLRNIFNDTFEPFLLKNALASVVHADDHPDFDPLICNAEFAFQVAVEEYLLLRDARGIELQAEHELEALFTTKKGGLGITDHRISKMIKGFFLFWGIPEPHSIVSVVPGFHELLTELVNKGDEEAKRLLLVISLVKVFMLARVRSKDGLMIGGEKVTYTGPKLEEHLPHYLERAGISLIDFFELVYSNRDLYKYLKWRTVAAVEDLLELKAETEEGAKVGKDFFIFDRTEYITYVREVFRPLMDHFVSLPADEKEEAYRELLDQLFKNLRSGMAERVTTFKTELFLMAVDLLLTALENDPELREDCVDRLIAFITTTDDLALGGNALFFMKYLIKKRLLTPESAYRIYEWIYGLHDAHFDLAIYLGLSLNMRRLPYLTDRLLGLIDPVKMQDALDMLAEKIYSLTSLFIKTFDLEKKVTEEDLTRVMGTNPFEDQARYLGKLASHLDVERLTVLLSRLLQEDHVFKHHKYLIHYFRLLREKVTTFDEWEGVIKRIFSSIKDNEDRWKLVPFLLDFTKDFSTVERRKILSYLSNDVDEIGIIETLNDDYYLVKRTLHALLEDDIDDLFSLFRSYEASDERDKIGVFRFLYQGDFFSVEGQKGYLGFLLESVVSLSDMQDEEDLNGFNQLAFGVDSNWKTETSSFLAGVFEQDAFTELWEGAFRRHVELVSSNEKPHPAVGQMLSELFPKISSEKRVEIMRRLTDLLYEASDDNLESILGAVIEFINKIDHLDVLMTTKPIFGFILHGLRSGRFDTDHPFVKAYVGIWVEKFNDASFDDQCKLLIFFLGRLLPIFRRHLGPLAKEMIGELGEQDPKKAFRFGEIISSSPYAKLVVSLLTELDLFDASSVESVLDGFIDATYIKKSSSLKKSDIDDFIRTAGIIFVRRADKAYADFLLKYFKMDLPLDFLELLMVPVRNYYLEVMTKKENLYARELRWVVMLIRDIIVDPEISMEKKRIIAGYLKQMIEEWGEPTSMGYKRGTPYYQALLERDSRYMVRELLFLYPWIME